MKEHQGSQISKIETAHGTPNVVNVREKSLFEAFKIFFVPRLRKQEELALAYEEAVVRKTEAEGEKLIEEAAKISAERDVAKQLELKQFCENVEDIFAPNDSPHAMVLKMAKLLETNPEVAAQLDRVNAVLDKLARERGCLVLVQNLETEAEKK